MRVVLSTYRFNEPGGTETYLLTVAEQLTRLGHEVTVHGVELGPMADFASDRGLHVVGRERDLPDAADALLAQDGVTACTLAGRYPAAPLIFVGHEAWDTWLLNVPPRLPETVSAVVVMNQRVERRVRAFAGDFEVVRLRQPIDTRRFAAGEPVDTPRRVLALSNYLDGQVRDRVEAVCADAGLELEHMGMHGLVGTSPEHAIRAADIVIAQGRSALEAMSCGRAVYVMDRHGSDGWVTPDNYEVLEAQGFAAGASTDGAFAERDLRTDLAAYRPEMGHANRELVHHRHYVGTHVHQLVDLWRRVGAREPATDLPLRQLAQMVSIQWQADRQLDALRSRNEWLERELAERRRELHELRELRQRELRQGELRQGERSAARLTSKRRSRAAQRLRRPLDAVRDRLARRRGGGDGAR